MQRCSNDVSNRLKEHIHNLILIIKLYLFFLPNNIFWLINYFCYLDLLKLLIYRDNLIQNIHIYSFDKAYT